MSLVNCSMDNNLNISGTTTSTTTNTTTTGSAGTGTLTGWSYWSGYYYPQIIKESYPVYIQERAQDKGKQAFEIIKCMQDKKLMKLEKVSDFIDAMDILIKIL